MWKSNRDNAFTGYMTQARNSYEGDDSLGGSYERCRQIHRSSGRTYYFATKFLPAWKRRHVHAIYGFTRQIDEIVDSMVDISPAERSHRLMKWSSCFFSALENSNPCEDIEDLSLREVLPAILHTVRIFDLDTVYFQAFLKSMIMDLTITRYANYGDLLQYMEGSAAAIGMMMLPILQASSGIAIECPEAKEPARHLGFAFQLTNFIRDVAEDLDRGRIYLPQEDLNHFNVTSEDLYMARARRRSTRKIRKLIDYEIARARVHYVDALPGIGMLEPRSQPCIRAAYLLYGAILNEVEQQDLDVFVRRAVVSNRTRLWLAAKGLSGFC